MSNEFKIILASASPRRKTLLESAGLRPEIVRPDIEEKPKANELPKDYTLRNAEEKAVAACQKIASATQGIAIAADTIVVSPEGDILEKPQDEAHAIQMLNSLSGRAHAVLTAFAIVDLSSRAIIRSEIAETKVIFRELSEEEVLWYVKTGEPFDKAGGYGIQERAAAFVEKLEGSYTNVVGLPLSEIMETLKVTVGKERFRELLAVN